MLLIRRQHFEKYSFLNLAIDILSWIILHCWGCHVHCRMFSSISGLPTRCQWYSPLLWQSEMSSDIAKYSLGWIEAPTPVENLCSRVTNWGKLLNISYLFLLGWLYSFGTLYIIIFCLDVENPAARILFDWYGVKQGKGSASSRFVFI